MSAINFTALRGFSIPNNAKGAWMNDVDGTTDITSNGNDLTENGTVTQAAASTGADLMAYSNFSTSNYYSLAYTPDLDFGTSGFSWLFWFKTDTTTQEVIAFRAYYTGSAWSGASIELIILATGILRCEISDDARATFDLVNTTAAVNDDEWHQGAFVNDGTNLLLYLDGALVATDVINNATGSLSNANATLRIGLQQDGTSPATNTELCLQDITSDVLTAAQIKTIYNKEKHLFNKYSYYTQEGVSYDLDIDFQSSNKVANVYKTETFTLSRKARSIVHAEESGWDVATGFIHRTDTAYLRLSEVEEFLYSTRGTEEFTLDMYGTVASADETVTVIRTGSKTPLSRIGKKGLWFRASFRMLEVA